MGNFTVLDHPADIGIEVYGQSIEDLFISAQEGVSELVIQKDTLAVNIKKEISLEANNLEELFTKWLDEFIYLFDAEGFLVKKIRSLEITTHKSAKPQNLKAVVEGEKFNSSKHKIKLYLKAVTYHQLQVAELKDKSWKARVYFDV